MKIKFEWETLVHQDKAGESLEVVMRAKVIDGWILRTVSVSTYVGAPDWGTKGKFGYGNTDCMVFIPDPTHSWEI